MGDPKKIKVLIVDDSAVIRQLLTEIISGHDDMVVVGTAADPYIAREKIKQLQPDVLTLDVEMPRMDGITFLKNLMRLRPMPVIMISTLTEAGADITLEALQIGAFDYLPKPKENLGKGLVEYQQEIVSKIRAAAGANVQRLEMNSIRGKAERPEPVARHSAYTPKPGVIIAIGASTGGTEAIKEVLLGLPENCPPVVVTQHIPPQFSTSYAMRMNNCCAMHVHEAESNQTLLPGNVYIAPGDRHLLVRKSRSGLVTQLDDRERVNRHRPSVEVMFDSITGLGYRKTVSVLLTGMGADGAQALLRMKELGCHTIIQDEATSVVWGMPGAAYQLGAYNEIKPLESIAGRLLQLTNGS
ncbi:chemotaxis response regulator protein-glutamate methylesterase [Ketobacter sp.]|uniref:protein-glutamate methylesterase/protein-glutamine glutaminase n=1 Tax=Ketobacter sp. TaxID=2083498 RepID=UPI000F250209|nr:chemotaxis response regulator protein-glutamate methylesterase [Ketobacter sp.]RLT92558.1 MAG: chemotaxis response regulator protein-glutamate methylesterase [Ketobacter sp.]